MSVVFGSVIGRICIPRDVYIKYQIQSVDHQPKSAFLFCSAAVQCLFVMTSEEVSNVS